MLSRLSWGIGRTATLLKTLLQYFGKSLEPLPGVAYPGFRDNRSTLNTKTGYKKNEAIFVQIGTSGLCWQGHEAVGFWGQEVKGQGQGHVRLKLDLDAWQMLYSRCCLVV